VRLVPRQYRQGDGPASASLTLPRDHTNVAWHGTVTDADIEQIIGGGGREEEP
jgi:hypothetical protein